ncbi:MAG: nucleotidyltransferase domain-containing protein, partial [Candidatus Acidiferrum sp.]
MDAEFELLIECARPNPDPRRLMEALRGPVKWPALLERAEEHGLPGPVALRLRKFDKEGVPPEILEQLRERQRAQALFTLRLTAELFRLFESFAAAGLDALVIKGPVLSVRCYGDPGARQYGDLDLIVRDKDILRSIKVMTDLGYEARISRAAIQAKKVPGEYAFRHSATKLLVEFHTEATFRYHPRPLPVEKLFQRRVHVRIDSHEIPALAPEDELILICIHGAKHLWERLIYTADLAALISRQELDWDRVNAAAAEVAAQRMLHVGLRLAAEVLGATLPATVAAAVRSDAAVEGLVK